MRPTTWWARSAEPCSMSQLLTTPVVGALIPTLSPSTVALSVET
jgi:hypothetical protein